jgi:hypothetical protein
MNSINKFLKVSLVAVAMFTATSCHDLLDEPNENKTFTEETDYTDAGKMMLPLLGVYAQLQDYPWHDFPVISVRGDDVNTGGKGDQQDLAAADMYSYNPDFWMFNAVWNSMYKDVFYMHSAMEQLELFKERGPNPALADQYIAEIKTMRAFHLLQLSRVWGNVFIITSSDNGDLQEGSASVSSKDEVMQHISDQMDAAIPLLPNLRPNERTDIRGGVTRYTALAIKAIANLELKKYQEVANATSAIISSGKFQLEQDFYQLFKIPGKLNNENLFELQYSNFGDLPAGDKIFTYEFFGPQNWGPKVKNAGSGWGFWEPSLKYIKFMLDRNETERLQTSVLFTDRGIEEIRKDPKYAAAILPAFVKNVTAEGDTIKNFDREMFVSGKHYLPSTQLPAGRTAYGTSKNVIIIRYAEILLMHAEALAQGATSTSISADDAVNLVRERVGLGDLTGVTLQQVMDEKFAELAMEWGSRYYDMVRLGEYDELSYEGRTFTEDKIFLPYPQAQVDLLPALRKP